MAKMFSAKLSNLENEILQLKDLNDNSTMLKIENIQNQINQINSKINQMIDEITNILNHHAQAIKDLATTINKIH